MHTRHARLLAAKPRSLLFVTVGFSSARHLSRGWRPAASGRPPNPGNLSVTASHPWPVLALVTQALLPVSYAWNASAQAQAGVPVPLTMLFRFLF